MRGRVRFADLSIQQKLQRASLLASLCALIPASIAFAAYDLYTIRELLARRIQTEAEIVGLNSITPLLFDDPDTAASTLASLRPERHVEAAAIYSNTGAVFASYKRDGLDIVVPPQVDRSESGQSLTSGGLVVFHPVDFDQKRIGTVMIRADLREIRARVGRYLLIVTLVLGLSLAVGVVISTRVQRAISKPIQHLAALAATVSIQKDYSVRAVPSGNDETAALIRTFNEMLSQIQERDEALRESHLNLEHRVEERTRELESRTQELEAFSYSVSHDLRGPLRGIDGFSRTLLEDYKDRLDTKGVHYLTRIRAGTRRMAELIDDLLHLARVTRAELVRKPVDLSTLARSVVTDLSRRDPARDVDIRIADGMMASADPHLLQIVLENLIGNAWKFTGKTAQPFIEIGRHDSGAETYHVRDNGAGFDMAHAQQLFGVFQRLHASSEFDGTGIGLATVQRIVTRHGGSIWAEASVGKGATFFFTLGGTN